MRPKTRYLTPQECVEYADRQSREVPEDMRLQVYWRTIIALAICQPKVEEG